MRCASLAAAAAVVVVNIFPDDDDDDDDLTPKRRPPRSSREEEEDKEDKEIARRHAVEKLKEEEDKEDLLPKREAFAPSFREMNIFFCAFSQSVLLFSLAFVGFTTEGKIRFSSSSEVLKNAYEFRALAGHTHTREREKRYTNESRGGYRGGGG